MQVNLNRPCPFWPDDGACALRDCSVNACKEVSIDYKYWKMAWRKAAETFQNVTIHGLVMRTCLILKTLQIIWYKLGYKPPEMEKVIFTLVTFKFFQLLLCNKHKIYCSLSFEHLKILYNELIQDHNFVLAISFLWSFPLAGNTLPLIPNIQLLVCF